MNARNILFTWAVSASLLAGCPGAPDAPPPEVPSPPEKVAITVTISGAGEGKVASTPDGVSLCAKNGGSCSGLFDKGSLLVLRAAPDTGFLFAGWSGGACAGLATCNLIVNQSTTVRATFVPIAYLSTAPIPPATTSTGRVNIWTVRSDGTDARPVTRLTNASSGAPAFSPDGNRILYVSRQSVAEPFSDVAAEFANVWTINPDGSDPRPLTRFVNGSVSIARWRPDGRIQFGAHMALDGSDDPGGADNFWVMNADGSERTLLTDNETAYNETYNFQFLPDGFVYRSHRGFDEATKEIETSSNIWRTNLDGSGTRPLTRLVNADAYGPTPSPDGSQIAFISNKVAHSDLDEEGPSFNLWVMNSDGTNARPLTTYTNAAVGGPPLVWTPDGTKLIFASNLDPSGVDVRGGAWNLFTVDVASGLLTVFFPSPGKGGHSALPLHSVDRTRVIFESDRALDGSENPGWHINLWIVGVDGTGGLPLTRSAEFSNYNATNLIFHFD